MMAWMAIPQSLPFLLVLTMATGCFAQGSFSILGLPLGITRDGGEIDKLYEETLKPKIDSSVLLESPYPHIETRMKDEVSFEIHFSSKSTGRKAFWIWHSRAYTAKRPATAVSVYADMQKKFGQPARRFALKEHEGQILIFRKAPATIPKEETLSDSQLSDFLSGDYQFRVGLLGKDFQGAAVTVLALHGNVLRVVMELIDHPLAASVLNPGS
jgi:hypothetical protein